MQVTGKLGSLAGLDKLANLAEGAAMTEEQKEAAEEAKRAAEAQKNEDPKVLADMRWVAKSAYIVLVSLTEYDDLGGLYDDAMALLNRQLLSVVCNYLIPWCDCSEKIEAWTKYNTNTAEVLAVLSDDFVATNPVCQQRIRNTPPC